MRKLLRRIADLRFEATPSWFWYADHLTGSAKQFLGRVATTIAALALGVGAVFIAGSALAEVIGGALLGAALSLSVWSVASYRGGREAKIKEIRRVAELDVLHARLNQIAAQVGAPVLGLQSQIEHATNARAERLAHFGSLDEFRGEFGHTGDNGHAFWDDTSLGTAGDEYLPPTVPTSPMAELGWEDENGNPLYPAPPGCAVRIAQATSLGILASGITVTALWGIRGVPMIIVGLVTVLLAWRARVLHGLKDNGAAAGSCR